MAEGWGGGWVLNEPGSETPTIRTTELFSYFSLKLQALPVDSLRRLLLCCGLGGLGCNLWLQGMAAASAGPGEISAWDRKLPGNPIAVVQFGGFRIWT